MRKLVVFNLITLDGYFARKNGDIDWHNVDDEFNEFAIEHTKRFGTLIFGRVTYKIFEEFWPTVINNSQFSSKDQTIAQMIEEVEKIVFSKTLKDITWNNTKLLKEIDSKEIEELKRKPGKDMAVFGSGKVVQQLTNLDLVDEFRLLVNPLILGSGKPLFEDVKETKMKLIDSRVFKNGNVLLYYKPVK